MKKFYHYIFYKLYRYMLTTKNSDAALNGAAILISMIMLLYLFAINLFLTLNMKLYSPTGSSFKLYGIMTAALIICFNYYYFKKNDRYLKIEERFKDENHAYAKGVLVLVFSIFAFISVIIVRFSSR